MQAWSTYPVTCHWVKHRINTSCSFFLNKMLIQLSWPALGFYKTKLMKNTVNPVIFQAKTHFSHLHPIISHFWEALPTICIGSKLVTCCLATWMLTTGTKTSFFQTLPVLILILNTTDNIKKWDLWYTVSFCVCSAIMVRQKHVSVLYFANVWKWNHSRN